MKHLLLNFLLICAAFAQQPVETKSLSLRFTAPGKDWTGTLLSRRGKAGDASLTVRDSVVGGHLVCAFTEVDASLDSGTHDLVQRHRR
jgi:hypothetical protein